MKKVLVFIFLTVECIWGIAQNKAEETIHSKVMAWSIITGVRMDGELIDFESALCVGNPDGKMEKTGRERQNNVRCHRDGQTQIVDIPLNGAHPWGVWSFPGHHGTKEARATLSA